MAQHEEVHGSKIIKIKVKLCVLFSQYIRITILTKGHLAGSGG